MTCDINDNSNIDSKNVVYSCKYPGRELQQHSLIHFIRSYEKFLPLSNLFIFGGVSTGKSMIVKSLFSSPKFDSPFTYISCTTILNEKILFEKILNSLYQHIPHLSNMSIVKCDHLQDFLHYLAIITKATTMPVYIIFDNMDCILSNFSHLISPLLRLNELINCPNIGIVMISRYSWDRYLNFANGIHPVILYFPSYSKMELKSILLMDYQKSEKADLHKSFIDIILNVFYPTSNNLTELRKLFLLLYPKYIAPILKNDVDENEKTKLFKNIQPLLRIAHSNYFQFICQSDSSGFSDPIYTFPPNSILPMEYLPILSRYLLIAAYLASYNPAKMDSRIFGDAGSLLQSRRKIKLSKIQSFALGPKSFPLERLLAIFYNIADEEITYQSNISVYTQLATLFDLGMIGRTGPKERLDEVKCKCHINLEFIEKVAKSVQFDIHSYLIEAQSL